MKLLRIGSAALVAVALAGCESLSNLTDLQVENQNAPDRERALVNPGDIESLIAGSWSTMWNVLADAYPNMALGTIADEWTVSWGNYDMRALSSEPRTPFDNSPSYRFSQHAADAWYDAYSGLSSVYDGLIAINTDATGALCDVAGKGINCDRVQAFAKFIQGVGHGYLALFYDSAFVFDETVDLENDVLALQGYRDVWTAARGYLEQAATLSAGKTWSIPASWMGAAGGSGLTADQLARLSRSFLARWIPQVARNPAERAAADWAAVISNVDNGITTDFSVQSDGFGEWWSGLHLFNYWNRVDNSWSRADYKTIGQYDTSGNYRAWLAADLSARNDTPLLTPDRRIHGSGGPGDRGKDFDNFGASPFPPARGTYHYSLYGGIRFSAVGENGMVGPQVYMRPAELQLYKAEGLLRTGNVAAAVAIINQTRVGRGEMAPVTTAMPTKEIMDALIYERRIESWGYSPSGYFNRRGDGPLSPTKGPAPAPEGTHPWLNAANHHQGLVEGTPLHFAPPGQELEILQKPIYTYGGVGNEGPKSAVAPSAGVEGAGTRAPAALVYRSPEERTARAERMSTLNQLVLYHQ